MIPESRFASSYSPSLGVRTKAYDARPWPPSVTIVHTTGAGPHLRLVEPRYARWRERHSEIKTAFDAARWIYTAAMREGSHYLVDGVDGRCVQLCPESLAAWHVGGRVKDRGRWVPATWLYRMPRKVWSTRDTAWWHERWPDLASPLELAGGAAWDTGSVNDASIGIEVVPPWPDVSAPWSAACWATMRGLLRDIAGRNRFVEMYRTLGHSDVHPRARSARGEPWDPPPRAFSPMILRSRLAS